jgi:hypothetical protein
MDVYEHMPSAIHDTGHINTPTTIDIHDTIMLIIFGRSCNIPATYTQFLASILCIHCRTQAEWVGGGMWELSFWSDYNSKCTGQRGSIATGWTHIVALKRDGTITKQMCHQDLLALLLSPQEELSQSPSKTMVHSSHGGVTATQSQQLMSI